MSLIDLGYRLEVQDNSIGFSKNVDDGWVSIDIDRTMESVRFYISKEIEYFFSKEELEALTKFLNERVIKV